MSDQWAQNACGAHDSVVFTVRGETREVRPTEQLDWAALGDPNHAGVQTLVRDLNALYRAEGSLHQSDADERGFAWAVGDDAANSVFAFHRRSAYGAPPLLCVVNMTPVPRHGYRIGVEAGRWTLALNSDDPRYAGSGLDTPSEYDAQPHPAHGHSHSIELTLPPLATIVLRHHGA